MASSSESFVNRSFIFVILILLYISLSDAACSRGCQCYRAGTTTEDWIKCDKGRMTKFPRSISRTREVVLIRDNLIQEIPANPFGTSSVTEVQYVFLDNNRIDTIADGAFSVPRQLRVLSLMNNRLEEITSRQFMGANGIEKLHMDGNYIVEIKPNVFIDMWRLKILSLAGNIINSIESNAFNGLAELHELYLNDNRLAILNDGIFAGFRDIKKIDLRRNAIHTISDTALGSLYKLEELILRDNRLFDVESHWFQDLTGLRILDLSHNRISHISNQAFVMMSYLHSLDLSNNLMQVMGKAKLQGLGNLMELKLANNAQIEMREGSFWELGNLEMLDVRNTSRVGMGVSMLYNKGNITSLERIKVLMLSGLSSLPVDLLSLAPNLESLIITDSNIPTIPERAFDNNIYLKDINMKNVGLTTIEKGALYPLRKLKKLDISNNNLNYLPDDSLLPYHRNLVVCFHDNPWHCNCSISWMTKWMQRRGARWCRNSRPVCQSPPKQAGNKLWELSYSNC